MIIEYKDNCLVIDNYAIPADPKIINKGKNNEENFFIVRRIMTWAVNNQPFISYMRTKYENLTSKMDVYMWFSSVVSKFYDTKEFDYEKLQGAMREIIFYNDCDSPICVVQKEKNSLDPKT